MTQLPDSARKASAEVDTFLSRASKVPVPSQGGRGRLIFALDATMSRQPTWDMAQTLQQRMFEETEALGGLDVQLVYFGYTACPDICPTTLSDLRNALKSIGKTAAGHVRVAMATIDPRRDSSVVLSGYLQSFFGDGVALRTDDDSQLQAAATAFGATYEAKYPNQGEPQVSHSTYLYAVDHTGHVVVAWPFGTTAADMAHDLELLLHREKEGAQ